MALTIRTPVELSATAATSLTITPADMTASGAVAGDCLLVWLCAAPGGSDIDDLDYWSGSSGMFKHTNFSGGSTDKPMGGCYIDTNVAAGDITAGYTINFGTAFGVTNNVFGIMVPFTAADKIGSWTRGDSDSDLHAFIHPVFPNSDPLYFVNYSTQNTERLGNDFTTVYTEPDSFAYLVSISGYTDHSADVPDSFTITETQTGAAGAWAGDTDGGQEQLYADIDPYGAFTAVYLNWTQVEVGDTDVGWTGWTVLIEAEGTDGTVNDPGMGLSSYAAYVGAPAAVVYEEPVTPNVNADFFRSFERQQARAKALPYRLDTGILKGL